MTRDETQEALTGEATGAERGSRIRIGHQKILQQLSCGAAGVPDLVSLYRDQVLPVRTRSLRLLGRKSPARIHHTLLGYEVQASYKRIQCPDLVTARYVKVFMELGCRTIKLPYDPTLTAKLVPNLEAAMATLIGGVRDMFPRDRDLQLYVTRRLFHLIRLRLRSPSSPSPPPS